MPQETGRYQLGLNVMRYIEEASVREIRAKSGSSRKQESHDIRYCCRWETNEGSGKAGHISHEDSSKGSQQDHWITIKFKCEVIGLHSKTSNPVSLFFWGKTVNMRDPGDVGFPSV